MLLSYRSGKGSAQARSCLSPGWGFCATASVAVKEESAVLCRQAGDICAVLQTIN